MAHRRMRMKRVEDIKMATQYIGVLDQILGGKIDQWLKTPNPRLNGMTPLALHEKCGQNVFDHFISDVITGMPG